MEAERSEAVEDPGGAHREADRRRENAVRACPVEGHDETSVSRRSEAPEAATGSGAPKRPTMSTRNGTSRPAQLKATRGENRWMRRLPASTGPARSTRSAWSTEAGRRRRARCTDASRGRSSPPTAPHLRSSTSSNRIGRREDAGGLGRERYDEGHDDP